VRVLAVSGGFFTGVYAQRMDIQPAISTPSAGNVRSVLVRIALVVALTLAAILLLDCAIHHQIIRFFIESEWYVLFVSGMLLVFFLSVLLGALRDLILPASRAWSDDKHVHFIVLFCIFGFSLLPAFYFVAVFSMVHNYGGGGGG
jgi:hypothetical protein